MHAPACIHKLEATLFDELFDLLLDLLSLSLIPHREELHLDVGELAVRVIHKFLDHSTEDHVDFSDLVGLVGPSVVLVDCLEPPNVIVSVGNQVNIELLILIGPLGIVSLSHLFLELARVLGAPPVSVGFR